MRLQRQSNGQFIPLNPKSELGSGGEARVFPVPPELKLVAKVYHQATDDRARKLAVMLANPPHDPTAGQGHISIAWPIDLLSLGFKPLSQGGGQQIVGFLMPHISKTRPIIDYYNPKTRRQNCPLFNYRYLHRTAGNVAAVVGALHECGYVIGDINESNILVTETALVTLVDTDSFQVRDPETGITYRCPVGKLEFTPPELQGKNFNDIDQTPEHDLFGLGVLLFQLLMEGTHPFAGVYQGEGDPPPISERIAAGHFPYGNLSVLCRPVPIAPPLEILSPKLQQLFVQCFEEGHINPQKRPNPIAWQQALREAENSLIPCGVNEQHVYGRHLTRCPWCDRAAALGGRDPFPSAEAVQQGIHLQPLPKPSPSPKTPSPRIGAPSSLPTPQILTGHSGLVGCLAISPDGQTLVSGSLDNTIRIWDFKTGQLLHTLKAHAAPITGLAITPDGRTLISGGWDKAVKICQLSSRSFHTLKGCTEWISAIAISPDGKNFVLGTSDGMIQVWDLQREKLLKTFKSHSGSINSVAVSPNNIRVASGSSDGTIKIWSLQYGSLLHTFKSHAGAINAIAFSPDGQLLASGCSNNTIQIWHRPGVPLYTLKNRSGSVNAVAFSPDGQLLASGNSNGAIEIWTKKFNKPLHTLRSPASVYNLAFSPNGQVLASGSGDGTIMLQAIPRQGAVSSVQPFARPSSSSSTESTAWLKLLLFIFIITLIRTVDNSLARRPAQQWQTSTGATPTLPSRPIPPSSWQQSEQVYTLTPHAGPVYSVAISPDGKTLVTASADKTIKIWDLPSRTVRTTLTQHSAPVYAVAISQNGRILASASADKTIKLWDLPACNLAKSCNPIRTLTGHQGAVRSLAITPEAQNLISASEDKTIKIWDLTTGKIQKNLPGYTGKFYPLAISPDGQNLAIAPDRETVQIWNIPNQDLMQTLVDRQFKARGEPSILIFSAYGETVALFRVWTRRSPIGVLESGTAYRAWNISTGNVIDAEDSSPYLYTAIARSRPYSPFVVGGKSRRNGIVGFPYGPDIRSALSSRVSHQHKGGVHSVAISPDGRIVVSGGEDRRITIWQFR